MMVILLSGNYYFILCFSRFYLIFYILGFSQKICIECKNQAMSAYHFRQMCVSTDENIRFNRKPLSNNEHDYSVWNMNDYEELDDLSEYLSGEAMPQSIAEPEIHQTPALDETQNFYAPSPPKKNRKWTCPVCGKLWVTPSKLKRHMSVHRHEKLAAKVEKKKPSFASSIYETPKRNQEVQCPICFLLVESNAKLPQHMLIHIKTEPRTEPKQEPQEAPNSSDSTLIAHKIGSKYICTVCGLTLSSPAKLTNHMKSQHMRRVSIIHSGSNQVTPEKMRHQPKIDKSRNNVCVICSKRFPTFTKLNRHIVIHQKVRKPAKRIRPRNHACQHCEKRFETPSKLQRHQKVHRNVIQSSNSESPPILEISAVTSILGD